jgi:hypothetical protein
MSEFDAPERHDPFEQPKPKPTGNAGSLRTMRMNAARDAERLYNECPDSSPEKIRLLELLEKLTKQHRPFKKQPKNLFSR